MTEADFDNVERSIRTLDRSIRLGAVVLVLVAWGFGWTSVEGIGALLIATIAFSSSFVGELRRPSIRRRRVSGGLSQITQR
ncbi:MAG TPA: hypothetical protein VE753_05065 [Gaiellaceae bacterium]|jgi:hypothetical protein|nr:hypothetical protein [Gaiellaceae bacterium]